MIGENEQEGKGTKGARLVRLSQDICGFSEPILKFKLGHRYFGQNKG